MNPSKHSIISWLISNADFLIGIYCFVAFYGIIHGKALANNSPLTADQGVRMVIGMLVLLSLLVYIRIEYLLTSLLLIILFFIFESRETTSGFFAPIHQIYAHFTPTFLFWFWAIFIFSSAIGTYCAIYTYLHFNEVVSRRTLWRNSNVKLFSSRLRYTITRFLVTTIVIFCPLIYHPLFNFLKGLVEAKGTY